MAKTARQKLGGQHLLENFAELDKPKRTLSKTNLTLMQVSIGKHVLATCMFLN